MPVAYKNPLFTSSHLPGTGAAEKAGVVGNCNTSLSVLPTFVWPPVNLCTEDSHIFQYSSGSTNNDSPEGLPCSCRKYITKKNVCPLCGNATSSLVPNPLYPGGQPCKPL